MTPTEPSLGLVKVWDRLVRIGHWLLVVLILLGWLSRHWGHTIHELAGYSALLVIAVRIVWGLIGSHHARFKDFIRSPALTIAYAREVLADTDRRFLGHNPLGGWMILALLITTLLVCLSGWLYTTDEYWGVEWVANLHESLTHFLIGLIVIHVAGVVFSSWRHRENLVSAMFTGKKRAPGAHEN